MATDHERYLAALHAMQTGVMYAMQYDLSQDTTPKHLRVGVNSAMVEFSALVRLLFAKGVITEDELNKAMADTMEEEVRLYEKQLSDHLGKKVTLA